MYKKDFTYSNSEMEKMLAASPPPAWFDKLSKVSDSHGATISLEWRLAHLKGSENTHIVFARLW